VEEFELPIGEHGGKLAGLVNVMGFALAAYMSTLP
jgi:hypothetical protein